MNKIDEFLNKFQAESTRSTYKTFMNDYAKTLKLKNLDNYFKTNRDYQKDVELFSKKLENRPPLTIQTAMSCVKSFLYENDIELKQRFWKTLSKRRKGSKAWSEIKVPTTNELKKILMHGDALERAAILVLSSSGMREGEACKLTLNDFHLDEIPPRIRIPGKYTKTGDPRDTFITDEAKNHLLEWIDNKKDYLLKLEKHVRERYNHYTVNVNDPRVFPFKPQVIRTRWLKLLKKAGYYDKKSKKGIDTTTNRVKMKVHSLRAFFRTRLGDTLKTDVIEDMMGHEGYLSRSYRHYTLDELRENYLIGQHKLVVFEKEADVTDMHDQIKELRKENEKQKEMMDEMKAQILELRLEKLEKANGIKNTNK